MKKLGNISKKEVIFYGIYLLMLLFECWPGIFFGNSATPFIFGFPFFVAYQYIAVIITVGFFVVHYYLDNKDGEMEFYVDPNYDYLKDIDEVK